MVSELQRRAALEIVDAHSSPTDESLDDRVECVLREIDQSSVDELLASYPDDRLGRVWDNESGFDARRVALRVLYETEHSAVVAEFQNRTARWIAAEYASRSNDISYETQAQVQALENALKLHYLDLDHKTLFDRLRNDDGLLLRSCILASGDADTIASYDAVRTQERERAASVQRRAARDRETMVAAVQAAAALRASRPQRSAASKARSKMTRRQNDDDDDDDLGLAPLRGKRDEDDDDDDFALGGSDDDDDESDAEDGGRRRPRRPVSRNSDTLAATRTIRVGVARFQHIRMDGDCHHQVWDMTVDRYRRARIDLADACAAYHPDAVVAARLENGSTMRFAPTWIEEDAVETTDPPRRAPPDDAEDVEGLWAHTQHALDKEDDGIDAEQMVTAFVESPEFETYEVPPCVSSMMDARDAVDSSDASAALLEVTRDQSGVEFLTVSRDSRVHVSTPVERRTLPRIVALERARSNGVLQLDKQPLIEVRRRRATHVRTGGGQKDADAAAVVVDPQADEAVRALLSELAEDVPDLAPHVVAASDASLMKTVSDMSIADRAAVDAARGMALSSEEVHRHVLSLTKMPSLERRTGACAVAAADLEALHPEFVSSLTRHNFTNFLADDACYSTQGGRPMANSKLKTEEGYDNFSIGVYRDQSEGRNTNPFVKVTGRDEKNRRKVVRHGSYTDACTANIVCNWLNTQPYEVRMCPGAGRLLVDFLMPPALEACDVGSFVRTTSSDGGLCTGLNASLATPRLVVWGSTTRAEDASGFLESDFYPSYGSTATLRTGGRSCRVDVPLSSMAACVDHAVVVGHMHHMLGVSPLATSGAPSVSRKRGRDDDDESTAASKRAREVEGDLESMPT